MAHALALHSRDLALELHHLLKDLDSARWCSDFTASLQARCEELQARIAELEADLAQWMDQAGADEALAAIQESWNRLSELLGEHVPDSPTSDFQQEWREFQRKLQPAYHALADRLRLADIHLPHLRPTNYARNAFHVGAALVAVLVVELLLGPLSMLAAALAVGSIAWTLEISRRYSARSDRFSWWLFGRFAHPHERSRVNSATWFSTALVLLALTGSPMLGALALCVLGFADPAAALVGRRFGRTPLVHGRTLEGTLAFVLTGMVASLVVLCLWHAALPWSHRIALAAGAAIPAALAELFARRIDDNLLIPVFSAAGAGAVLVLAGLG